MDPEQGWAERSTERVALSQIVGNVESARLARAELAKSSSRSHLSTSSSRGNMSQSGSAVNMPNMVADSRLDPPLLINRADELDLTGRRAFDLSQDKEESGCCASYEEGSLWGSVFNLCSATLGAGCLSLPHAMKQMGLLPALALCLLTGFASHLSIVMLAESLHATDAKSFEDLSVLVFGRRTGQLVGGSIFVIVFGSAVAYTIALGDILDPLIQTFGAKWLSRDLGIVFFWALLMVPLSLVEKVSALRFTSLFGVLALVYLVIAMSVHFAIDASLAPKQTTGAMRSC